MPVPFLRLLPYRGISSLQQPERLFVRMHVHCFHSGGQNLPVDQRKNGTKTSEKRV